MLNRILAFLCRLFVKPNPSDAKLIKAIERMIGKKPINLELYRLAMRHTSRATKVRQGFRESNERLEYLGDAVLGSIVAEYLFRQYPFQNEGFLTEIRSRIVNRETLNALGLKIGLRELLEFDGKRNGQQAHKSIYGDAFEAFIGAIYLDRGFRFTQRFVIENLLKNHYDIDDVVENSHNYKSKIIEWAQKNGSELEFRLDEHNTDPKTKVKQFKAHLIINGVPVSEGYGYSKKKASQDAARKACVAFEIK